MDANVKRLVEIIKEEASKDELFSMDRIRETKLYKALFEEYENLEDVCEMAFKKSTLYERTKELINKERVKYIKGLGQRVIRDGDEKQAKFLVFVFEFREKEIASKFKFRYSADELKKLALDAVKKYPVK